MSEVVNIIDTSTLATVAAQGTGNASLASLDGKTIVCNTGAVTVAACALPTGAATAAAQVTGNASLSSLDGKVTACNTGAVVVASSALPTGAATAAAQATGNASVASIDGKVTACNTGAVVLATGAAIIGAVTGPSAVALAKDSTLTDATQRAGVLGADGATLASASNPVPVTPGTSTLWDVKDRLTRALGILTGRDGTTAASVTNGLPVAPETSSVWDVSSRAARLIGALTGINGSGVATGANPVPVQLSDGAAVFTAAKDSTLTGGTAIAIAKGAAATGTAVSGSPVYVGGKDGSGNAQPVLVSAAGNVQIQNAKGTTVSSTAAEASRVISASPCLISRFSVYNGNAAARYGQIHNATSLPSNGAVPSSVIVVGTTQTQVSSFNIPTDRCSTGCVVALSTTGGTLTIAGADALFTVDLFPTNV